MPHHELITGHETPQKTLELFWDKNQFNRWLVERLTRMCKDNVLEIGSGIGNISRILLEKYSHVSLSDLEKNYCDILEKKFLGHTALDGIYQLDVADENLFGVHPELRERFDSIIASNVVEHVANDERAVVNCYNMLRPGGRFIVLVPAYNTLYNSLDHELGHVKRYNKKSLSRLLSNGGFNILSAEYFNLVGIAGWWASGFLFRDKILPAGQLRLYEKLVPVIRYADRLVMRKIGLSIIICGEKK